MGFLKTCLGKLLTVGDPGTPAGRALLDERYRALRRQMPLLYLVALVNLIGLHLATGGKSGIWHVPTTLLVLLILFRLAYWIRIRNRPLPPERIVVELRKTLLYGLLFSTGFSIWGLYLLGTGDPAHRHLIILFGSLSAFGCAYSVSSFAAAARLPLLFLALPISGRLILFGNVADISVGLSLGLVSFLILRLLGIHERSFIQLVESRASISAERERARRAEKAAKSEKTKVRRIADTDSLTGLANRRAFLRLLGRRCGSLRRTGGSLALAMVDLDGFKPINDTFGHAAGDAVLVEVGGRLQAAAGPSALVARTGGDEFALLLPSVSEPTGAAAIGAGICSVLQEAFIVDGREFRISGCCGLTILASGECDVSEALIRADTALYRAKQNGRAGVAVFTPEMDEIHRRRNQIEHALRLPEAQAGIGLLFQPIFDLATGELRALEALARWEMASIGPVSPAEFIPIAEHINVIKELSDNLLAKAAHAALDWAASVRLSFNMSAVQLCTDGSARRILAILEQAGMDPSRFQIEVTETALLVDFSVARGNLQQLRDAGARILLDDFGTGHASISYLSEMQFDGVKLDGSLIASVGDSMRSRRLLKGVLDLCASLGLPCVAEHIETDEQVALLRELGCRDGQGFILSTPLSAADAAAIAGSKVMPISLGRRRG